MLPPGSLLSDHQGLLSKTFITTCPHDCKSFLTYGLYAPSSHQHGYQTPLGWHGTLTEVFASFLPAWHIFTGSNPGLSLPRVSVEGLTSHILPFT